jgi:monomeric sarcosine oxidase
MATYDAIVLGAGAMGSAAAYHLAKSGQRVLLLEQFRLGHTRGSSHGSTRIIRYSYDDPRYVQLAKATYPLWFKLEEEAGETLYIKTGGIDFGQPDEPTLDATIETVRGAQIPHEILDADEGEKRFPQFRFDAGMTVLYQPDSGLLAAERCIQAHQRLAEQHGATIHDSTPVTGLTLHGDSVEITTPDETHSAGRLVVTAGSWAGRLLASTGLKLPLQPLRCQPAYFMPVTDDPALYLPDRMPVSIFHREGDINQVVYTLPNYENGGVKAAFHGGQPVDHPDDVDYTPYDGTVEAIRALTRRCIPAIGDGPLVETNICLYTMTPDTHFVIDRHPQHSQIVIGAGFSGHGFKFSAVIGSILCDLALEGTTQHDISLFGLGRFG